MEIDAELLCYREPWGTRAEWKGGRYATTGRTFFRFHNAWPPTIGQQIKVGGITVQVVERQWSESRMFDTWIIARAEDPVAWLRGRYRQVVYNGLHFILRCEAAVMAFRLKYNEGEQARFTAWVASKLL